MLFERINPNLVSGQVSSVGSYEIKVGKLVRRIDLLENNLSNASINGLYSLQKMLNIGNYKKTCDECILLYWLSISLPKLWKVLFQN